MEKTGNRLAVLTAGMMVMLCSGAAYIWGVFQGPLVKLFSWSQASTAFTFSLTLGIFGLGTVVGGRIVDKFGPREVTAVGGLFIGGGIYLASWVNAERIWLLWMSYGAMMGFGIGMIYTPIIVCLSKWYPDKKGMITGLVVGFLGAGGLIFTPIAKGLVTDYGVLETFSIMGLLIGCIVVGSAFLLKNPPENYRPAGWTPPAPGSVGAAVRNYPPSAMLSTPQFYALAVIFLIGAMSGLMVIPFSKILATQAGLSDAVATSAIMLISIGNASGRLIWGTVSDKLGRLRTLMVILCISGTTMLFLNQLTGIVSLVGIGIVAFCYGGVLGTMPATTADFFGAKNLGTNYGLLLLAFSASAIGAPIIAGMAKDATGDFKTAFLIGGVSCLLALAVAFFTKPPVTRE